MKAQDLKRSILQLAIQGKLVPQNPSDEPASELLKKIKAEKEALVKAGKIKKDKQESYIYKGSDNNYYEKIGNEVKDISDEIPFDIPENWCWVRIGTIFNCYQPKTIGTNCLDEKGQYFVYGANGIIGKYNQYNHENSEILLTCRGATCGNVNVSLPFSWINGNAMVMHPYSSLYNKSYFVYMLQIFGKSDSLITGTAQPQIVQNKLNQLFIPLPPLSEQERIVKKIEELEPFIEEYGKAEVELTTLNSNFPEQIKKSILQYAIQGKLVEQDPNDEPASVLLEKIKAEKQELVKQGKIKKDKQESYIFKGSDNRHYEKIGLEAKDITEEIPFEIPENWEWVRLGSVVYNHGQKTPDNNFVYIDISSIDNSHQQLSGKETILTPKQAPSRARKIIKKGDIIYSTVRPYLHNTCIIDKDFSLEPIASTGFAVLSVFYGIDNKFLFYYLISSSFDAYANDSENSKGVVYPAINDNRLYKALIPIPPLNEQKRIIDKITKLYELIENLEVFKSCCQ